jgi:hypothetical protein
MVRLGTEETQRRKGSVVGRGNARGTLGQTQLLSLPAAAKAGSRQSATTSNEHLGFSNSRNPDSMHIATCNISTAFTHVQQVLLPVRIRLTVEPPLLPDVTLLGIGVECVCVFGAHRSHRPTCYVCSM